MPDVQRRNDLPSKDDAEGTILEQVQGLNLYLPLRQIGVEEVKKLNELVEGQSRECSLPLSVFFGADVHLCDGPQKQI